MKTYFNVSAYAATSFLDQYQYCATQPHLSGNYQVDLLLRNHNWAGGVNKPTALTYKMVAHESEIAAHKADFWSNEGKTIVQALKYLQNLVDSNSEDQTEYLKDYIEFSNNRDVYQLYETNFASSKDQEEYTLSVRLENIKRNIAAHPENEELQKFNWLRGVESIYELDIARLELPSEVFEKSPVLLSDAQKTKLDFMFKYTFNLISEVANLTFAKVEANEDISLFSSSARTSYEGKDGFFALESFSYLGGKTGHLVLSAGEAPSDNEELFSHIKFDGTLHGIGHGFIDHPNDASVAIRENLLPTDYDWSIIDDNLGISNEYRADNACMSVMAFTKCFYQGKAFGDFLTYMPIDIQAMQHIYGKNELTRSGDTSYILTVNQTFIDDSNHPMFPMDIPSTETKLVQGEDRFLHDVEVYNPSLYTLYDAGGINSFDLSQVSEAKIDLNQGAGHFNAVGNNYFLIAYGVDIHNVVVNSGNIEIKLNELANNITIPSNGAHVVIERFSANDRIILGDESNQDLVFSGCVHPYSNIGDNETEVCFI